jgi:hypothetical protein
MSLVLDEPAAATGSTPAQRLRTISAAVRVAFTWFGTRKTLSPAQKAEAADTFGAEGAYVSAAKKLFDTKHAAFKAVTGTRHKIVSYWKGKSLPFPEPGVRLIRQEDLATFDAQMSDYKMELADVVATLNGHYAELKSAARNRLGRLFDLTDYPASLAGLFDVTWDFPSVEPPNYLAQLSPTLYAQECARVAARFDEAVGLAEEAFLADLNQLVSHLTERLSGQEDGKPKVFRDSAVDNLTSFFDRFRQLNIRSNQQLDDLVSQAQRITRGVQPQALRDNQPLRQRVARQLSGVQSVLDGLLVDRPRRQIVRPSR